MFTGKRIHFLGIGGVGMAGLAFLLKKRGHIVTGCDKYSTPRTRWLESEGIPVSIGHSPSHLSGIDAVVATPAMRPEEPEFAIALERCAQSKASQSNAVQNRSLSNDIDVRNAFGLHWRGDVLATLVNASDGIAICGTHGKTTTATFTAKLLRALGDDPSWCIGGETGAMPVAGMGTGPLVVEADESDGTLAHYSPATIVLNAVDFDHLEHFSSPDAYFACYSSAIANTRSHVIFCADHPKAAAIARAATKPSAKLISFGFASNADVSAADWPEIPPLVLGRHNVLNALAAVSIALARGHSRAEIAAALPSALSELPNRRFEIIHPNNSARTIAGRSVLNAPLPLDDSFAVVTDYAHHPAELSCAVEMARALNPKRLRVLFQPHRHSRTRALLKEFPSAFSSADEITLLPTYAAFEDPIPGGDIADLYSAFRELQLSSQTLSRPRPNATLPQQTILWPCGLRLARSPLEAWRHVFLTADPGDLILLAGAGNIIDLVPRILQDCAMPFVQREFKPLAQFSFFRTGGMTCGGGRPIIVGQGSNIWFSDCADDCEIIRPPLPIGATLGIPWMVGIPGTVGGWAKMNAGAFGHSFSECIESVTVELSDGSRRTIPASECGFGYRTSSIPGLIVDVKIKENDTVSDTGMADCPQASAEHYLSRRKRFPPRTCGSVFKNPQNGRTAGQLLDAAGAKSLRVGGAKVWEEHANVIVAEDGATSSDILALARLMARAVEFKFGISLEPEIRGIEVTF